MQALLKSADPYRFCRKSTVGRKLGREILSQDARLILKDSSNGVGKQSSRKAKTLFTWTRAGRHDKDGFVSFPIHPCRCLLDLHIASPIVQSHVGQT